MFSGITISNMIHHNVPKSNFLESPYVKASQRALLSHPMASISKKGSSPWRTLDSDPAAEGLFWVDVQRTTPSSLGHHCDGGTPPQHVGQNWVPR